MKKLITFLMALVLVFTLVGCETSSKEDPQVSNKNEVFASVKDGAFTYSVTRGEMYINLKKDVGTTNLISLVDEYLLTKELNSSNVSYLSSISNDEVKQAIDKDVYGKEELTDEEKQAKAKDFLDAMFTAYGISAEDIYADAILKQYKLSLAQKAYAKDHLLKDINENDTKYAEYNKLTEEEKKEAKDPVTSPYYTDSKYESLYNADNANKYQFIAVPFTTEYQALEALNFIEVEVNDGKWVKASKALTNEEVVEKFLDLYELVYGYNGKDLTANDERFNVLEKDINTNISAKLKKMDNNTYTPTAFVTSSGALYVYILKISETLKNNFNDLTETELTEVKKQYQEKLYEDTLTTSYILNKMAKLRKDNNLVIYDSIMEAAYINNVTSYNVEHEKTKKESKTLVASVDGKEFTVDELFNVMDKTSGAATLVDLLVVKMFLNNTDLNKYYNAKDNKWIDNAKKEELEVTITNEKKSFNSGAYKEQGYDPAQISWKQFLVLSYGVENEDQLLESLVSQCAVKDYQSKLNYLVDYTKDENEAKVFTKTLEEAKNSVLWTQINKLMEEEAKNYFSVKGIHFLVSTYKDVYQYASNGSGLSPLEEGKWTDTQKAMAKKLIEEVSAYVKESTGTYLERLKRVVDAYKVAPLVVGTELSTLTSENGVATINLSLYKQYGLQVKTENLGTFTNGQMVKEFNDAVKGVWTNDINDGTYSRITVLDEPIETMYGYHLYINLSSNSQTNLAGTDETKRFVPTLEEIRKNAINESVSSSVSAAITKYYSPFASEIGGTYFSSLMQYNKIKKLISTLETTGSFDKASVDKYLELYIDYTANEYLNKVTKDFIE